MLLDAYLEKVQSFLKSKCAEATVVVMPDFFLDRFVSLRCDAASFSEMVANVVKRKGGSIDGITQTEFRGGNAVNTASALANLGIKVIPIICTDKLGLRLLRFYVKNPKISFSHIKVFDKPSITTALEFEAKRGKVNVMLRDLGSLADFGPQHLNAEDFNAFEEADYICVFNWAGTRNFGTVLAETVFRHVKTRGRGKTYLDTADPTPNKEKVQDLMKKVLQTSLVDILSLNENEAIFYASQLSGKIKELKSSLNFEDLAKESAKFLAAHLHARIDLHTTFFSATFTSDGETIVPAFQVPVLRATGAGDAWNAGNILGNIYGVSDEERLTLANVVAAYYISNPNGKHPTRKELIDFCNKLKGRWITKTDKN
ncbi:MAG: carbohydrate kinase family protein [Candidatus Bathyarchaeales archaeon]